MAFFVECSKNNIPENKVHSIKDLANKKVGVIKGTTAEAYAIDFECDSNKMVLERFTNLAEMRDALFKGELDAVLSDDVPAKMLVEEDASLQLLDEALKEESYAGVIAKNNWSLLDSVNIALIQMRATGAYDSIMSSYVSDGDKYHFQPVPTKGAALRVATYAKFPPFVYYNDNKEIEGADIDIARYVANHMERPLEIIDMEFEKIIDAVRDGKVDLGLAAFSVTDDRKQIIDFTYNYATSKIVVIVRSGKPKSFFQRFKDSIFKS